MNENGQGLLEYFIIFTVVALVVIGVMKELANKTDPMRQSLEEFVNTAVQKVAN